MPPKNRPREEDNKDTNSSNNKSYDWKRDPRNPAAALFRRGGNVVTNRTISKFQVTAEQLIAESYELHNRKPGGAGGGKSGQNNNNNQTDLVITSREELDAVRSQKRKKYEEILRRDMSRIGSWMSYAAWEEGQKAMENVRGIFERAISHLGGMNPEIWINYSKAEMRSGDLACARQVLERSIKTLPSENSLWLHAILLEKSLLASTTTGGNTNTNTMKSDTTSAITNNIRDLFTQWISHKPGHPAWREFIRFELSNLLQSNNKNNGPQLSSTTHQQQSFLSSMSSSSSSDNQIERIRSLLNRYIEDHNEADSWLFYASCEQQIASFLLTTMTTNYKKEDGARRIIKILETGLKAVPESKTDQTDAARLALATAKAYEIAEPDGKKAKDIYLRLLDQFLTVSSEIDDNDDDDDVEQHSAINNNNNKNLLLKRQLREVICDALGNLEKRNGSLEAAAAVEERRKRWELEQQVKQNDSRLFQQIVSSSMMNEDGSIGENNNNNINKPAAVDESSIFLSKLQLLQLERSGLKNNNNTNNNNKEQRLMKLASLYEQFCFPSFYISTSSFLESLSICWESFVLFCEQELLSQKAAGSVIRKAIEFLNKFSSSSSTGIINNSSSEKMNNEDASSSSSSSLSAVASSFSENRTKTLLLSKLLEFTAMLHLRSGNSADVTKFRMCMRLAIDIVGSFSDELHGIDQSSIIIMNKINSNDQYHQQKSNQQPDCFGFVSSTKLRIGDRDFELHPLFGSIIRWIEIEKKIVDAENNTDDREQQQDKKYKQINDILFFCLKFRLCRQSVDFWHLQADATRSARGAEAEISLLEEALQEVFGQYVFSFDEDVEEAYNSILCRLLRVQLMLDNDDVIQNNKQQNQNPASSSSSIEFARNTLETHVENIEEIFIKGYLNKLDGNMADDKENNNNEDGELLENTEDGSGPTTLLGEDGAPKNKISPEEMKEIAAKKLERRRRWYDSLLMSALQMMQQFFFSTMEMMTTTTTSSSTNTSPDPVVLTRDFYKRTFTRIRRKCGTEVSVNAVKKLWNNFEDEFGNEETKKAMFATTTAATQRTNRLFARAKKI